MVRRVGVSFGMPPLQDPSLGSPNPSVPFSAGSVNPNPTIQPIDSMGLVNSFQSQISQISPQAQQPAPAPRRPRVYFSESTGRMHVGGFTFEERDASAALESRQYLAQAQEDSPPPQDSEDWRALGPGEYEDYIDEIVNPGAGRLFAEGWERGLRGMQTMAGASLQFVGAEDLGSNIVEDAARGYQRNAPFERRFSNIDSPDAAIDWFVSSFGEGLPSVLESVAVALAGAAGGTAAAGPVGTVGGALAGLFGKAAFRQQILSAARRRMAGEALDQAEIRALRAAGALTATVANSYATGVGDIYGSLREAGAEQGDVGARLLTAIGAAPYAALESLPEFVAGEALFGGARASTRGGFRGAIGGAGTGFAAGVALEGATEAGQEGINIAAEGIYGQPMMTQENAIRILESFAAGAAIGGPIGGVTGMASGLRKPVDVLGGGRPTPAGPATPTPAPITPPAPSGPPATSFTSVPTPATSAPTAQAPRQEGIGLPLFDAGGETGQQAELFNTETLGVVAPDNRNAGGADRAFTGAQGELFPDQNLGEAPQGQLFNEQQLSEPRRNADQRNRRKRENRLQKKYRESAQAAPVEEPVTKYAEADEGPNELAFLARGSIATQQMKIKENLVQLGMDPAEAEVRASAEVVRQRDQARADDIANLGKQPKRVEFEDERDQQQYMNEEAERAFKTLDARDNPNEPPTPAEMQAAFGYAEATGERPPAGKQKLKAKAKPVEAARPPSEPKEEKPTKPLKVPKEEKPEKQDDSEEEAKALISAVRAKTRTAGSVKSTVNGYVTRAGLAKGKTKYTLEQAQALKARVYEELDKIAPPKPADKAKLEKLKAKKAEEAAPKAEPKEEPKADAPVDDRTKRKFSEIEAAVKAYRDATPDKKSAKLADLETEVRGKRDVARQWALRNPGKESEEVRKFLDRGTDQARFAPSDKRNETVERLLDEALELWGERKELPPGWWKILAKRTNVRRDRPGRPRNDGKVEARLSAQSIRVYVSEARDGKFGKAAELKANKLPKAKTGMSGDVSETVGELINEGLSRKEILVELNKRQLAAGVEKEKLSNQNSVNQLVWRVTKMREKGNHRYADASGEITKAMPHLAVKAYVAKVISKVNADTGIKAAAYENVAAFKQQDPKLYAAVLADSNGDTDALNNSAGFYLKGDIVIFSDKMLSKQYLASKMAHELFGHAGILGTYADAKLSEALNRAHKESRMFREATAAVVRAGRAPKNSRLAMEEAFADIQEQLPYDLLTRIYVAIRRILKNIFGIAFSDEAIFTMMDASRTYLKSGRAQFFGPAAAATRFAPKTMTNEEIEEAARKAAERTNIMQTLASVTSTNETLHPNDAHGLQGFLEGARARLKPEQLRDMLDSQKNKWLATLDDNAQKSPLLQMLSAVFSETAARKNDLITEAQAMRTETLKPELLGGPKTKDMEEAADMMTASTLHLHRQYDEDKHKKALVDIDDTGNGVFNEKQFNEYAALGTMTPEQFKKVPTYFADGTVGWTPEFNVTKDSKSYKVYLENRKLVNYLLKELLLDTIKGAGGVLSVRVKTAIENVSGVKREATPEDIKWFENVTHEYLKRYFAKQQEGEKSPSEQAELFLENALKTVWLVKKESEFIEAYGEDPNLKGIIDGISSIRKLGISKEEQIKLLGALQRIALDRATIRNAEKFVAKSIISGYFPIMREGTYQVRIAVTDKNGNAVNLDEDVKNKLNFYKADTIEQADELAKMLDEKLGDKVWEAYDDRGQKIEVKFQSVREKATQTAGLSENISVEQFKDVATRIGIRLTPEDIELVVTALTATGDKARRNLERAGNPGWNRDTIKSVSIWSEFTASSSAKRAHRYKLDNLMRNDELLYGSATKLERLQKAFDNAKNEAARIIAENELLRYARMYSFVSPVVAGQKSFEITTRRGKLKFEHQARANEMRDLANVLLKQYHNNTDLDETPISELGGLAMTLATTMQLGGSAAAGALNTIALWTHFAPYMAETNPRFGRGGGFGDVRAAAETMKALGHMLNNKFSDRQTLEDIVSKKTWAANNLTEWEAKYLYNLHIRGTLDAQMNKALLGTTRSKITDRATNEVIKRWMGIFSYTEQLNRRVAALAAIRLYYERLVAAGVDPKELNNPDSDEYQKLLHEVETVINHTQFNYSNFNRPLLIKGPWAKLVLMYKMFVIGSLQLIKQLPARQQVQMLALLVLLAGLKGLPFAEDIMDLIDGIAQRLGIRMASVELELAELSDALVPGSGKYLLNGVVNSFTGATIGTRLGFGDIIPFTGLLRQDVDLGRELEGGFGPVYSALRDSVNYAGFIADFAAQSVGLKDRTSELGDLVRRAPLTGLRQFEGAMWGLDGEITDRQGRVISDEAPMHIAMLRTLGFYPYSATEQNDIVRLSRYVDNYAKRIAANYRNAYASAQRRGDRARMREIENDVREWNRQAREAGDEDYVIDNFRRNALRSAGERNRTTLERYERTTGRDTAERLAEIYGLED